MIFRRIIFLSQCRKISYGHLVEQCYRHFPAAKKFVDKGGGDIKTFRREMFLLLCRKIS